MSAPGLTWIYDTEQPDGVLDQHHGASRTVGDREYRFIPTGVAGDPVAVMNIADGHIVLDARGEITNPLTRQDVAELEAILTEVGRAPIDSWNGAGTCTVSFRLPGRAHPALLAAVGKYHAGCPEHNSVFCSVQGCRWFRDGRAGLISPTWPQDPS